MSDVSEKLKASVLMNLNMPEVFNDLLDEVLEPALDKLVKDTNNGLDDALKATLYPLLAAEAKKLVEEAWAKALAPAPVPIASA